MDWFLLLELPASQRWLTDGRRGLSRAWKQTSKCLYFFFFEAAESVPHSLADGILMKCGLNEYRSRIIDANVNRVLPREVAQAVMVPTTLVSRIGVRDIGKDLPRIEHSLYILFGASKPKAQLETFPACIRSGDTSGTTIVPACSPHVLYF